MQLKDLLSKLSGVDQNAYVFMRDESGYEYTDSLEIEIDDNLQGDVSVIFYLD